MKHILYAIGFINLLLVNVLFYFFWFLPMKKKGTFESVKWDWDCWALKCDVANNTKFFKESMDGWWGFVVGSFIIFVDYTPGQDEQHEEHEKDHVLWNYILGVFFYPTYMSFTLFIFLFLKNKHPYLDNPLERSARRSAGQKIDIPREEWTDGPNDRWPWW